ncbi:hypothetical protein SCLCIDRAFT_30449 [Scleroderma citrinum Foug A]|uniref:Uncharacterized protein n=1 Tax=Scleroderma citrinum Foug A TaxID=1036808 RepID=A0A0C2ZRT5_9AGAM|nr:hypothetical protein SCLCIDRAFT_30449 [Scleroderma citrinum Foug A]
MTSCPLQKKHLRNVFSSPNRDQLKEALQSGGACEFDVRKVFWQNIIQVDFYPIPVCNLDELIHTKMAFDIKTAELFSGNIRLDCSVNAIVGVGAFKTAHIGSVPNHDIVLKWPYINDAPDGPACPPFTQFTLKDESNILYHEANVLYWAKALLKMT